ncbi:MAG: hypothetical protein IPP71_10035 [Bacteroidetes bacterium]|nr:hypothetical protein [Bacteroidota bacterium]
MWKCAFTEGISPYFHNLPIALKLQVPPELLGTISADYDNDAVNHDVICIKPSDLEIVEEYIRIGKEFSLIIIGNELYNITNKTQLGQDLDFVEIFDKLKNEPIWLQLSGGKSYIPLSKTQCKLLGVNDFPKYLQNIWLEKYNKENLKFGVIIIWIIGLMN